MGGSIGKNKGSSSSSASQNIWGPQGNFLQQLWGSAMGNLGNNFMDKITGAAGSMSDKYDQIFNNAMNQNQGLAGGGAFGNSDEIRQKLLDSMGGRSNMGSMYESIVGGSGNTYIDPMIDRLRSDAAQNMESFRGSNSVDAAMMGQSGSSRQAMEDAMFGAEANKDLMNKEAELRMQGYAPDLAMKMQIAQQADSNRQADQNRLLDMLYGSQGSQQSAMQGNSLLQALASGGMNPWLTAQQAGWNPFNNMSNILGAPIILGSSSSSGKSKGFGGSASLFG